MSEDYTYFPEYVLTVKIPDGFIDASWSHDACPKWENKDKNLALWVDYENRDLSDCPSSARFLLESIDQNFERINTLIESDNYQDILDYIGADTDK